MSRYIDDRGSIDLDPPPRRPPVPPVGDTEAMQLQLSALGEAARNLLMVLIHGPVSARHAADFAAVCDQSAQMALGMAARGAAEGGTV